MPAQAGIHLRFRYMVKETLDSGFRRNDGRDFHIDSTDSEPLRLEPVFIR